MRADLDFQDGLSVTQIAPGVVTIEIGTAEVTTAMLQDALITAIKMAPNSVETAAIKDANVTTPKIADGNVTLAKLAPNSVDSSKIVDGSITAIDIAPGTFPEAGLTLLFEDTFNASTARSFNNVFTAAYDNYVDRGASYARVRSTIDVSPVAIRRGGFGGSQSVRRGVDNRSEPRRVTDHRRGRGAKHRR
jgi:hypothetical protein